MAESTPRPRGRRRPPRNRKAPSPRPAALRRRTKPGQVGPARARRRKRAATRGRPRTHLLPGHDREELDRLGQDLSWSRESSRPLAQELPQAARRLRILMVGWEFPPSHTGGLGVHCYELCRELGRMGHHVTFLTPFSGPFTPVPGVEFRWPGGPRPGGAGRGDARGPPPPGAYDRPIALGRPVPEAMVDYNEWIATLDGLGTVDLVHVHDWFGTVGAVTLARRLRRPLVMTVHSTEYDRSLGHPWREILEREQVGLDLADRVIAVSRHLKSQLVERYRVPPERIHVIYNAVRPPERLARLDSPEPMVLYLGRLAAMKGVDTFLRAGARALRQVPGLLLVVAGEGPEFPRLLTLAVHLGISDRTVFLGKVNDEERSALLARASVFVLPSVVEPFGIAALEAMAAGVPTIVSKTSGVAEVAANVFAVDFWDIDEFASRIAELVEYPTLRSTMGARGRADALRTGWAERALETAGLYAELLLAGNRP